MTTATDQAGSRMETARMSVAEQILIAARAGQVKHHRVMNGPTAPDFYRYEFTVADRRPTAAEHRAIVALIERGAIKAGGFAGRIGQATEDVEVVP